jgi:hypothetical protein
MRIPGPQTLRGTRRFTRERSLVRNQPRPSSESPGSGWVLGASEQGLATLVGCRQADFCPIRALNECSRGARAHRPGGTSGGGTPCDDDAGSRGQGVGARPATLRVRITARAHNPDVAGSIAAPAGRQRRSGNPAGGSDKYLARCRQHRGAALWPPLWLRPRLDLRAWESFPTGRPRPAPCSCRPHRRRPCRPSAPAS